jgi:hypothetical protein
VNPQGQTFALVEAVEDTGLRFGSPDSVSGPQFLFTTKWCWGELPHPELFSSRSLIALGEALVTWVTDSRDLDRVNALAQDRDRALAGDAAASQRLAVALSRVESRARALVTERRLVECLDDSLSLSSWLSAPETIELRRASRELHLTMPSAWDGYEAMSEEELRSFVDQRLGPRYDAATIQLGKFMVEISVLNPTDPEEREGLLRKLVSSLGDENSANVAESAQWLEYLAVISGSMSPLLLTILEERQSEFETVMSDFYESVCKTLGYELKEELQATGYVALVRLGSAIVETSALRALGLSNEKWLWHDGRPEDDLRWSEPSYALWREMRNMLQPRGARNVLA